MKFYSICQLILKFKKLKIIPNYKIRFHYTFCHGFIFFSLPTSGSRLLCIILQICSFGIRMAFIDLEVTKCSLLFLKLKWASLNTNPKFLFHNISIRLNKRKSDQMKKVVMALFAFTAIENAQAQNTDNELIVNGKFTDNDCTRDWCIFNQANCVKGWTPKP